MATTVDTLLIRIQTDMKGVRKDLDKIQRQTKKSTDKMNKAFAGVGKVFKLAMVAVVVRQAAQAAIALTKLASGVEEMQAKSSVVFGKFTDDFRAFTVDLAKATGRSRFELEAMGSTVQDTFVPMGFAREEATELSKQLTKLAVDVASFNNKADTEVMEAFQSALVGNHETMRQFGVVITEATIKQELLRMGLEGGTKAASNSQKVQARLNLMIAGTADAQGDAVKTANSYANRVREMQAALNDLGVEIGTTLMPHMKELVQTMTELTHAASGFLKNMGLIAETDAGKLGRLQKAIKEMKEAMLTGDISGMEKNISMAGLTKTQRAVMLLAQAYVKFNMLGQNQEVMQPVLSGVVLSNLISQEEALSKKLALEEKITKQMEFQAEFGEKGFGYNRLNFESTFKSNLRHVPKVNPRTLGNQQVGTSSHIVTKQQDLGGAGSIATMLLMDSLRSVSADVDKAVAKHRAEQDKNKLESVKSHDIKMAQLKQELIHINKVQTALDTGTAVSKSDRQQQMFDKLLAQSEIHHADENFTEQDRKNNIVQLRLEADALVAIEMANEANVKRNNLRKIGIKLTEENTSALDKLKKQQASLNELKEAELITDELHQKLMDKTIQQLKELEPMYKIITDGLKQVADTISQTFADAFMQGKLSLDSLANLVKSTVGKMIAHVLKMQVIAPILSALGMSNPMLANLGFAKLASGGAMQSNRPYLVGERGAELFVPSGAGTLMNNHNTKNAMGGGGMIINQSINVSTGVAQTVRAEIANLLPAIRNDTMRAVADGKRRGGSFAKAIG